MKEQAIRTTGFFDISRFPLPQAQGAAAAQGRSIRNYPFGRTVTLIEGSVLVQEGKFPLIASDGRGRFDHEQIYEHVNFLDANVWGSAVGSAYSLEGAGLVEKSPEENSFSADSTQ